MQLPGEPMSDPPWMTSSSTAFLKIAGEPTTRMEIKGFEVQRLAERARTES